MKTVLIASLLVAVLLNVRVVAVCAQQKISAPDFVHFVFHQLDALTDHHNENVSDCLKTMAECEKAMTRNVKRDDDAIASLDKMRVPDCLAQLRTHFREVLLAHRDVSATYAKVLGKPQVREADLNKVEESQRHERVEIVAILDAVASDPASACGDNSGEPIQPGSLEPR
jgi:hypothetical protein